MNVDETTRAQQELCKRHGADFVAAPPQLKIGIARNVREGLLPINGLRHPPIGDTTGWYIWAGEALSDDPEFFLPLHVAHLVESCPIAIRFLGLPPGWRFLVADEHEDVWKDPSLLNE
ncbi:MULTISPECIES: immunity protein Imm33 domain-containing protein [Sorangium]|uniref:immunity protein Imm33 domain-containing protein n=1 Tax=Sorangium TaxID=39643 RepID=UPI003D9C5BE6